eukprot:TRINITY_DN14111_c0_g1_i1.p1 TRINITY_DN14111_c0_g1~~TRINITY_DN14111_c0_g1_i1.p1  ORF type:complete len:150 (-),score=32.31 TRINITY_DN14111_c0_g1_i1:25-474(-)
MCIRDSLLTEARAEILNSKDIVKIMSSIYVFCWLLLFEQPTRGRAFQILLGLLVHRFPKVRKLTADELYVRIMTDEMLVSSNHLDAVLDILSGTKWNDPLTDDIKAERDKLYDLLDVKKPVMKASTKPVKTVTQTETDDYSDLVRESGY